MIKFKHAFRASIIFLISTAFLVACGGGSPNFHQAYQFNCHDYGLYQSKSQCKMVMGYNNLCVSRYSPELQRSCYAPLEGMRLQNAIIAAGIIDMALYRSNMNQRRSDSFTTYRAERTTYLKTHPQTAQQKQAAAKWKQKAAAKKVEKTTKPKLRPVSATATNNSVGQDTAAKNAVAKKPELSSVPAQRTPSQIDAEKKSAAKAKKEAAKKEKERKAKAKRIADAKAAKKKKAAAKKAAAKKKKAKKKK